ncbi:hypothetical protein A9G05_24780 [Pseudomonas sp. ENNP23]|nr:hypothetical protein A9G05_24780 [Pseudomonas sp. ENNP23]
MVRQTLPTLRLCSLLQTGQTVGQLLTLIDVLPVADGATGIGIGPSRAALPGMPQRTAEVIKRISATPLIIQALDLGASGDRLQAPQVYLPQTGRADNLTLGSDDRVRQPFEHMPLLAPETMPHLPTKPGVFQAGQFEAFGNGANGLQLIGGRIRCAHISPLLGEV